MISKKNFTKTPVAEIPADTDYFQCNFARPAPIDVGAGVMRGTRLFPGDDTPRNFTRCNLVNCEPPPGSTLVECNTWIVENNVVTSTDRVRVNGGRNLLIDHHSHLTHGRFNPDTESYDDEPAPVVAVID